MDKEKECLVEFLAGCASIGYAKSCKEVMMAIAQKIAECRNPEIEITKAWWDSFKSRHPEVALLKLKLPRMRFQGRSTGYPIVDGWTPNCLRSGSRTISWFMVHLFGLHSCYTMAAQ